MRLPFLRVVAAAWLVCSAGCAGAGAAAGAPVVAQVTPVEAPPAVGAGSPGSPGSPGELRELPPVTTDNKSALLIAVGPQIVVTASSSYPGWPTSNATDGDVETSWYSGTDDSAAKGRSPFIQLELPEPSRVRRVTILGNRDPHFLRGYTIRSGRIDLLDGKGRVLASRVSQGTGNQRDFDIRWPAPVENVSAVRFTSVADEGDKNAYGDVAIAEFQVE